MLLLLLLVREVDAGEIVGAVFIPRGIAAVVCWMFPELYGSLSLEKAILFAQVSVPYSNLSKPYRPFHQL
jgi:hypothetical protein